MPGQFSVWSSLIAPIQHDVHELWLFSILFIIEKHLLYVMAIFLIRIYSSIDKVAVGRFKISKSGKTMMLFGGCLQFFAV